MDRRSQLRPGQRTRSVEREREREREGEGDVQDGLRLTRASGGEQPRSLDRLLGHHALQQTPDLARRLAALADRFRAAPPLTKAVRFARSLVGSAPTGWGGPKRWLRLSAPLPRDPSPTLRPTGAIDGPDIHPLMEQHVDPSFPLSLRPL